MELPTYTSIWRIEKRLYKLYDFRLPMPLPVGQLAVFAAITVPYIVLLTLFGLPFNHNLFWLYVLPPGLLTWLATRPVLESKRLPELIISQARYLAEPASWCRMAPNEEGEEFVVVGRVWRRAAVPTQAAVSTEPSLSEGVAGQPAATRAVAGLATDFPTAAAAAVGKHAAGVGRHAPGTHGTGVQVPGTPGASGGRTAAAEEATAAPGQEGGTPAGRLQWPAPAHPVHLSEPVRPVHPAAAGRGATGQVRREQSRADQPKAERQPMRTAEGGHWPAAHAPERESHHPARYVTGPAAPGRPRWPAAPDTGQITPALAPQPQTPRPPGQQPATVTPPPPAGTAPPSTAAGSAEPPSGAPGSAALRAGVQPSVTTPPPPGATSATAPAEATVTAAGNSPEPAPAQASQPLVAEAPVAATPPGAVDAPPVVVESPAAETPAAETAAPPVPTVTVVPAQRAMAGGGQAPPSPPRPAPTVERALGGPAEQRAPAWRSHVTVVPGGRGPGRPDSEAEAKARAVLPLDGPRLAAVLGCTVGAGQTVTALVLASLLAELRGEPVAALDLNPGPASLAKLARSPAISASTLLAGGPGPGAHAGHAPAAGHRMAPRAGRGRGRFDVVCADTPDSDPLVIGGIAYGRLFGILESRYALTFADPGAAAVASVLSAADQLVLVAPASPDAARAVGMTLEWLGANGFDTLRARSVMVLNGVSQRSQPHAQQAEAVVSGRCRAIVRVPWDDHLAEPATEQGIRESLEAASGTLARLAQLRPAVQQAYTALAGVVVTAMADSARRQRVAR